VFKGVEQPRQFREQTLIRVLKLTTPMKSLRQELAFAIEIDAAENSLSASREGVQVLRNPARRDLAIGVGGQDHAVGLSSFHEPSLSNVHCPATSVSRVGRCRRQLGFDDADV
jgi:hypothetical protein